MDVPRGLDLHQQVVDTEWEILYSTATLFATATTWFVARLTSLFNSFCSNVAKQVSRFCCTFYRGSNRRGSCLFDLHVESRALPVYSVRWNWTLPRFFQGQKILPVNWIRKVPSCWVSLNIIHYLWYADSTRGVASFSTSFKPGWLSFPHILKLPAWLIRTDLTNTLSS